MSAVPVFVLGGALDDAVYSLSDEGLVAIQGIEEDQGLRLEGGPQPRRRRRRSLRHRAAFVLKPVYLSFLRLGLGLTYAAEARFFGRNGIYNRSRSA